MTQISGSGRPTLIAHRGNSSETPENTLASVHSALAVQPPPEYIEIDLHRTADGEILVIHDGTIDRTSNGKGEVAKMTLAEIRQYSAGYPENFGGAYSDEPFPVLDEVLDAVLPTDTSVMIEIKAHGIGDEVAEIVTRRGEVRDHVIASFHADVVAGAHMTNPQIRTLFLSSRGSEEEVELADLMHATIFGASGKNITPEVIELAHEKGLLVWIWTIDSPDDALRLLQWGADGIITNRPGLMRELGPFRD